MPKTTPKKAAASKRGAAFVADDRPTLSTDPAKFSIRDWSRGAGIVVKSVDVCGKPQLIGEIEELKTLLERAKPTESDDRPYVDSPRQIDEQAVAEELEDLREQVLDSFATWKLRGLRDGERDAIRAKVGDEAYAEFMNTDANSKALADALSEFEYRVLAHQVVSVGGHKVDVTWEDMRFLHVGDGEESNGLGAYFMQTIVRTANAAANGVGVDVPFSLRSSALTSPKQ